MLKRVYHLKLYGEVSAASFNNLRTILRKRFLHKPLALAVSINSTGGSVTAAKNISRYLQEYSLHNELPLFTFADDLCLGSANIVLASGYQSFANPFSLIGDWGASMTHTSLEQALKKLDIDMVVIKEARGPNKDRMSLTRDLNEGDKEL